MKINNENETYTVHFIFSYEYSTYQIIKDPCNQKQCQHNISSCGETRNITQDYFHEEKFQRSSNSLHIEDIVVFSFDIQKEKFFNFIQDYHMLIISLEICQSNIK